MTKAGKRLLSAAKEMTEMADWKARAEAAEATARELAAHVYYLQNHIGTTEHKNIMRDVVLSVSAKEALETVTEWAEAAEARVKELEARKRSLTEDVMTLGAMVYDENAVEWRERALKAERHLTVTDDMVERAAKSLCAHWGMTYCTDVHDSLARAALTAALENRRD